MVDKQQQVRRRLRGTAESCDRTLFDGGFAPLCSFACCPRPRRIACLSPIPPASPASLPSHPHRLPLSHPPSRPRSSCSVPARSMAYPPSACCPSSLPQHGFPPLQERDFPPPPPQRLPPMIVNRPSGIPPLYYIGLTPSRPKGTNVWFVALRNGAIHWQGPGTLQPPKEVSCSLEKAGCRADPHRLELPDARDLQATDRLFVVLDGFLLEYKLRARGRTVAVDATLPPCVGHHVHTATPFLVAGPVDANPVSPADAVGQYGRGCQQDDPPSPVVADNPDDAPSTPFVGVNPAAFLTSLDASELELLQDLLTTPVAADNPDEDFAALNAGGLQQGGSSMSPAQNWSDGGAPMAPMPPYATVPGSEQPLEPSMPAVGTKRLRDEVEDPSSPKRPRFELDDPMNLQPSIESEIVRMLRAHRSCTTQYLLLGLVQHRPKCLICKHILLLIKCHTTIQLETSKYCLPTLGPRSQPAHLIIHLSVFLLMMWIRCLLICLILMNDRLKPIVHSISIDCQQGFVGLVIFLSLCICDS